MGTLRVELQVRDYDLWRGAFARDAGGRQRSGVRRYRIFRPVDDPNYVMVDLDFDSRQGGARVSRDPANPGLAVTGEGAGQDRDPNDAHRRAGGEP